MLIIFEIAGGVLLCLISAFAISCIIARLCPGPSSVKNIGVRDPNQIDEEVVKRAENTSDARRSWMPAFPSLPTFPSVAYVTGIGRRDFLRVGARDLPPLPQYAEQGRKKTIRTSLHTTFKRFSSRGRGTIVPSMTMSNSQIRPVSSLYVSADVKTSSISNTATMAPSHSASLRNQEKGTRNPSKLIHSFTRNSITEPGRRDSQRAALSKENRKIILEKIVANNPLLKVTERVSGDQTSLTLVAASLEDRTNEIRYLRHSNVTAGTKQLEGIAGEPKPQIVAALEFIGTQEADIQGRRRPLACNIQPDVLAELSAIKTPEKGDKLEACHRDESLNAIPPSPSLRECGPHLVVSPSSVQVNFQDSSPANTLYMEEGIQKSSNLSELAPSKSMCSLAPTMQMTSEEERKEDIRVAHATELMPREGSDRALTNLHQCVSDSYQGDIFDEYFNDSGTFHQKTNDYSLNRDPIEDTTIGKELLNALGMANLPSLASLPTVYPKRQADLSHADQGHARRANRKLRMDNIPSFIQITNAGNGINNESRPPKKGKERFSFPRQYRRSSPSILSLSTARSSSTSSSLSSLKRFSKRCSTSLPDAETVLPLNIKKRPESESINSAYSSSASSPDPTGPDLFYFD